MFCKMQNDVSFLKIAVTLLFLRPFGSFIFVFIAPTGFDSSFKMVNDRCTKYYVTQKLIVTAQSFPAVAER